MTEDKIISEWRKICSESGFRGEIRQGEELRKHTSLRIGGPADIFLIPASVTDLIAVLKSLTEEDIPYYILGHGSNLLISDRGVRGIVIQVGSRLTGLNFRDDCLVSEAGVRLPRLAQSAAERGLSGLEFAAGIPGTIGGAVVMNAGGGGGDISQAVSRVRTFKPRIGVKDWNSEECGFGYRTSRFRQSGEIILEVEFKLDPGSPQMIKDRMNEIIIRREKSLPLQHPSAGSVFKNPPRDYAGRLIEAAGLKGKRVGDAQISEKHANIIVNHGRASFRDVEELIDLARKEVEEKFGIGLELELELWQ
jgi:UDP-N-acetylmuramate dehydrogenase